MGLAGPMLAELSFEVVSTRKVLERIPRGKFDWAPHPKSLTMGRLASHVAALPSWVVFTIEQDELDIDPATFVSFAGTNAKELVKHFDEQVAAAKNSLEGVSDETLLEHWRMRMGEQVLINMPRIDVLRVWVMNHMIHHRAQLTVYLRENEVAVPAIYGRSADEVG